MARPRRRAAVAEAPRAPRLSRPLPPSYPQSRASHRPAVGRSDRAGGAPLAERGAARDPPARGAEARGGHRRPGRAGRGRGGAGRGPAGGARGRRRLDRGGRAGRGRVPRGLRRARRLGFEDWLAAEREQWRRRGVEVLVRCADRWPARAARGGRRVAAGRSRSSQRRRWRFGRRSGPARSRATAPARSSCASVRAAWPSSGSSRARRPGRWSSASAASGGSGARSRPRAPMDAAAIRPPIGGRAGELARLLDGAARSARAGRASLLMLEGEAGIGKSRLLGEMLALLRLDGTSVGAPGRSKAIGPNRGAACSRCARGV